MPRTSANRVTCSRSRERPSMSAADPGFVSGRRVAPRVNTPVARSGPAPSVSLQDLKSAPRKPGEASFFYLDHHFQYNAVKVLPGEYFVSDANIVLMTVLGSCISACLWDTRAHVGGMNHFMLPEGVGDEGFGRYGSYAMELLINE